MEWAQGRLKRTLWQLNGKCGKTMAERATSKKKKEKIHLHVDKVLKLLLTIRNK